MSEEGREKLRAYAAREAFYEKNPMAKAGAVATGLYEQPEEFLSPEDRRVYSAGRRAAALVLRKESGAAISAGEYLSWDQQYLPQPGEGKEDLEAKRRARQDAFQGLLIQAGPGAAMVQRQTPQQAPQRQQIPPDVIEGARRDAANGDQEAAAWLKAHGF
jgi:hypothetical protein